MREIFHALSKEEIFNHGYARINTDREKGRDANYANEHELGADKETKIRDEEFRAMATKEAMRGIKAPGNFTHGNLICNHQ